MNQESNSDGEETSAPKNLHWNLEYLAFLVGSLCGCMRILGFSDDYVDNLKIEAQAYATQKCKEAKNGK